MSREIKKVFEKNKYVILSDVLTKKQCQELTNYMFSLYEQGKLEKDKQCPLSDSVYGDPVFDDLLEKFAKPIGDHVGKELLPTYTYCRIYRKGEVLKRHKDRPACEISATMTLGFDAEIPWPIFFDEEKETSLSLEIGEMAVYKGCEILHWRPKFKGEWQVQVFFHYVDANGKYKDHALDGRKKLGMNKTQKSNKEEPIESYMDPKHFNLPLTYNVIMLPTYNQLFPGYTCIDDNFYPELMFTKQECEEIKRIGLKQYETTASVGGSRDQSIINREIRSTNIYPIDANKKTYWIFDKIGKIVSFMNHAYYDYELLGITHNLQMLEYDSDIEIPGHYDWHVDAGTGECSTRKLSCTIQLSDEEDYDGCELLINDNSKVINASKNMGSVHLFPSYTLHKVTPITSGKRYSLVIWVHGSGRFR